MNFPLGILFSVLALFFWGFSDFFIQKSARKFGDWESLFGLSLFGTIIIFPFIFKYLGIIQVFDLIILLGVGISFFVTSLINLEALKRGKLSVVEATGSLEIPVSGFLAFFLLKEGLDLKVIIFIFLLVAGIVLVSLKPHHLKKSAWVEKGVFLAMIGALSMGLTNFMVGFSSRIENPLLTVWFFNVVMLSITFLYLFFNGGLNHFFKDLNSNKKLLLSVSAFDNLAWIFFALATTLVPIVIALAFSEGYIILSALLGIYVNKEKLLTIKKLV
jgi:drug/metabolite transporter (DMT)-like permease